MKSAIHLLSPVLISKIAAGEVIRYPRDVIKELAENSIDAGASQITIRLQKSGLTEIIVTDNGRGMTATDLSLAALPHTTSKISQVDDLYQIDSLGFRGEALASMAAVSELSIKSRPAADIGYQVDVKQGQISQPQPIGLGLGTQISLKHLFQHLPARLKFQKQPATELRKIMTILDQLALVNPHISWQLFQNQKLVWQYPAQTLLARWRQMMGLAASANLQSTVYQLNVGQLQLLSAPLTITDSQPIRQLFYVNGRAVKLPTLQQKLNHFFHPWVGPSRYPVLAVFLTLPPERIDVNIHPQKAEVKIADQEQIISEITDLLSQKLATTDQTFHYHDLPTQLHNYGLTLHDRALATAKTLLPAIKTNHLNQPETSLWQLNNLYLVMTTPDGLLIIDQHAAHERILYEKLLAAFGQSHPAVQELSPATIMSTTHSEKELLLANLNYFNRLGWRIQPFAGNDFQISQIPALFSGRDQEKIIKETLAQLIITAQPTPDQNSLQIIAYLACRGAIKAGQPLSAALRQQLVTDLLACNQPTICPHGRPTMIKFNEADLAKLFGRK